MKKLAFFGLVIVLLAVTAIPVFAGGPNNGHGNGTGTGQGNNGGAQTKQQEKNQSRNNSHGAANNPGKNMRMRAPFYLQGTITAIDTANHTVTISVYHGNARVKQFIGTDLIVTVTDMTKIYKITQGAETDQEGTESPSFSTNSPDDETSGSRVAIPFDQLAVNDIVAIHGNVVNNVVGSVVSTVYNATLITVYDHLAGIQPGTEQP